MPQPRETLSIGELAARSGLGISTIRAWEHRYGRPAPVRIASGHRRYTARDLRWLLRVCEALRRGLRPAAVVPLGEAQLARVMSAPERTPAPARRALEAALGRIRRFDRSGLDAVLARWRAGLPAARVIVQRIAPLIERVGAEWAEGRLSVRHEHFATLAIEAFLLELTPVTRQRAPRVLLATLAGERHALGLAMAASFVRLAGAEAVVLGPDVPNGEIVAAARDVRAAVVAISVSAATGGPATDTALAALRARLSKSTALVVGGAGARGMRRGQKRILYPSGLEAFHAWLGREALAEGFEDV